MPALFRRNLRPLLAAAVAAVLVLGVAAPVHSQESEETTGTGSSALTVVPATLDVDGLPEEVQTAVGTLLSEATNAEEPVARLALDGLTAAGELSPTIDVSSADGDRAGDESRQVGAGGVSAAVSLVDYAVTSGADSATSHLSALGADVSTPIGLGLDVDAQQVATVAEPTRSAGAVVLTVTGLELGLGDLLPAELLEALPLSVVLDLAGSLDLPLPTALTDQIADLEAIQTTLQDAVDAATELDSLETQLAAAIADDPTLSALQDEIDALETEIESLETEIESLEAQIESLETEIAELEAELASLDPVLDATEILALESDLATAESDLTTAETDLATAQEELAQAESDLADAEAELAAALDEVTSDLLTQIEELENLLDELLLTLNNLLDGFDPAQLRLDLLDALTGTPLVDLGALTLDLGTVANATGSEGRVGCETSDLQVLGNAVPAPTCEDISAAISGVGATIRDALATLPVTAPVPEVTIGGLSPSASGLQAPNADGRSSASAGVTALSVDIGSVDLTGTVDELVAELEALVAELETLVDDLDLTDGLAGNVSAASSGSLASTGPQATAVEVPASLGEALADLQGALDTLPLGDGLDGLSTLGIGATLGTVDLTSSFVPSEPTAVPRDPSTPTATPESPEAPTGSPEMPRTGGENYVLFMAALAAVAAGAVTTGVGRSVELGLHRAGTRHPR